MFPNEYIPGVVLCVIFVVFLFCLYAKYWNGNYLSTLRCNTETDINIFHGYLVEVSLLHIFVKKYITE